MSSPHENPNAVDVAQASELTGLSKKALRRRVERGTLDSIKVGGKRLIPISELENHDLLEFSSEPKEASAPPAPSQPARPSQLDGETSEYPPPPTRTEPSPASSGATPPPSGVE